MLALICKEAPPVATIVHREFWVTAKMHWWTIPAIEGLIVSLLITILLLYCRLEYWKVKARR